MPANPKVQKQIRAMVERHPQLVMEMLLRRPLWPRDVKTKLSYTRMGDDNRSVLSVGFTPDADGFVDCICKPDPNPSEATYPLRFRTSNGGGISPHTRNALLILAQDIVLDENEHPQDWSKLDLGEV